MEEEKIQQETKLCVKVTKLTDEAKLPACMNEFNLLQSLEHPGIMKCHEIYPDAVNNQCLTVLERVRGQSLDQIPSCKALATTLFRQACDAVSYMHSLNVCHRDLKPDNLIIDGDKLTIIDFNVGARMAADGDVQGGQGLKEWSAPETRRSLSYNGAKSDVWSLGLILGYMLSGKSPKAEMSSEERAHQAINSTDVPELREVLTGLLTLDAEKRLSAEECLVKLASL